MSGVGNLSLPPVGAARPAGVTAHPAGRPGGAGAAGAKAPRGGGAGRSRGGANRAGGGVRESEASRSQTSGACRVRSGGCTERLHRQRLQGGPGPVAAMVKISFQPAVAGIKGDKADKASASAPAPGPAAEILLTPARVRGAGGSDAGRGTTACLAGPGDWHIAVPGP